ncbi:TPR repeat-containing protein [Clostridium sporogenes]|uniref:Ig-like domain-containing protein n=1 Tax=Clostridium botulinum TaxID=1491 RepID=UPI0007175B96|nr:Ig-like domain-containing protein [Clostridium botulinum]KRU26636.1 TPR repeat-containing protein [Clostridium sporogenes]KRU29497.1 TPR repeat-containing protein [Clostridium sporogenes]KRU35264.1 TPR repeat-containing protein [Clostridium sporogenes]KRU49491.1 TPR repeat-containing protein [Clostridium sporogenes]MBZ1328606.1 Ig-like domain-containing protein [Clostridium botulinum]
MRKKAIISLLLILITMLSISGCGKKEKTSVLTNDVKQQEAMKENEVEKFIKKGTDFLNAGKHDDAKSSFEKAILMEKSNKESYIQIKNKYMEKDRLDDAYYFIKLAVNNNVDTENMEKILSDIKSKFQVTKLYVNVYQNNEYKLPDKIKVKINNEDKEVGVIWNNDADTSEIGTIKYQGKIEQYDRCAELYLKVLESPKEREEDNDKEVKSDKNMNNSKKEDKDENLKEVKNGKQIGFINEIYERNGKRYLKYDDVEFFKNKDANDRTAEREAIKDGKKLLDGRVTDDYYLRNKDNTLENYEISPNVDIYVCKYRINANTNATDLGEISYESFKNSNLSDKTSDFPYSTNYNEILCYIYLENNVVVRIEEQYRP